MDEQRKYQLIKEWVEENYNKANIPCKLCKDGEKFVVITKGYALYLDVTENGEVKEKNIYKNYFEMFDMDDEFLEKEFYFSNAIKNPYINK